LASLLGLTAAADAAEPAEKKPPLVAVLHFRNKLGEKDVEGIDNAVRSAVLRALAGARVRTTEPKGQDPESCADPCELEQGRSLLADSILSGDLIRLGSSYKLVIKLHDVASGQLLGISEAAGASLDELARGLNPAVKELVLASNLGLPPAAQALMEPPRRNGLPDLLCFAVADPKASTVGAEISLSGALGGLFIGQIGVNVAPHPGGRLGLLLPLKGGRFSLAAGPRALVVPLPDGLALGGGLSLQGRMQLLGPLQLFLGANAEVYKTATQTLFTPLLNVGLALSL
jgi:hypothetical protein